MAKELTRAGREFMVLLVAADMVARRYHVKLDQAAIGRIMAITINRSSKRRKKDRIRYQKRHMQGLCPLCGEPATDEYVLCRACRDKNSQYRQQRNERSRQAVASKVARRRWNV